MIVLSNLFQVTVDVLLKDELSINGTREVNTCGNNAIRKERAKLYEGALIQESIEDENLLDYIRVHKIELWNTGEVPKYWTVIFFTSDTPNFPELASRALIADHQKVGNPEEKAIVCHECRMQGILDNEMNWSE